MQTLEEQIRYRQEQVNKMPQAITLDQAVQRDDANSILQALPSYKDNSLERFAKGAISGLQSMSDITPSLEIYGQQIDLAIGGYFGAKPETINRKALNLATSYRNMQAKQQERYKYSNPEDVNSWAYGIGQGAFNYGLMLVGGGLVGAGVKAAGGAVATQLAAKTAAGLGANVLLENVEQQSERMPLNEENQINSEQITPEWAKSSAIGTTAYLATSTLLEKGFGFGKQVKMWETPIKSSNKAIKISSPIVKQAGKTALSEGATEGLQSLASTGILLVEGKIDASQLPERLQDAWKEAVIGGLLGGTAGTAVAINQAHNVKTMLNDEISKVVTDPEECEKVVDAIYESGTAEMTNVISKELELSSELNAKHGAIYDSMQGAIYDAINNAGAFQGVEETEVAQYVSDTSKVFANQVLAEANKRGVLIDEVLKASDIKFENGRIYMQAGKEVIAETPVVEETVKAEIKMDENGQTKLFQDKDYQELNPVLQERLPNYSSIEEFNRDYSIVENLTKNGAEINSDGTVTLYHAGNVQDILKDGRFKANTAAKGGMTGYDSKSVFFGFNKDYVKKWSSNGTREIIEIKVPLEYIKQAAQNQNEVYLDGDVVLTDKENNIWTPQDEIQDNFYTQLPALKAKTKLKGLFDSYNKQNKTNQEITPDNKLYQETDQTETEAFKKWSNNAPLVTSEEASSYDFKTGEKVAVEGFHGTNQDLQIFDYSKRGASTNAKSAKAGFWFVNNKNTADSYADFASTEQPINELQKELDKAERRQDWKTFDKLTVEIEKLQSELLEKSLEERGAKTYKVYLKFQNPLVYDAENSLFMDIQSEINEAIQEAQKNGNDGVIIKNLKDKPIEGEYGPQTADTHYLVFNNTQIKSVDNQGTFDENNPNIYMQLKNTPKQPKIFKGAYDVSAKAIELFKDADYSTLPHELAHYWLDNMWGYYRSGKASEAYSNNFKGVLDWLEVKDGQINLTRNQQEKFARGYEKYLLNGYAPNGLIQGAFDDYDKWLQKVYNDARELKVKLTPDAIEFFDTMTTGELPEYDVPETQAEIREKNIEQMNKDIETARKFVVEKQAEYNNFDGGNVITKDTVPVTTEGDKKQSRAYTNQASILGIAEQLNYNKADIAEQNKLASEYVKNNLDEARQVVNGEKEAPSDILKNAIYNAYLKEMLAIGDNEAYVNALKNQSLELTRAGQEIASQRGAIENIFDSGYWIRRIESLKKSKLASQKFGKGFTASEQEQALSKMNDFIKNKVEAIMPEFMKATAEEQQKIAEKLSKEIAAEFKVKPDTKLYQSMYEPSEVRTRTNAYNYIYRYINSALGLDLTKAQYNEIIAKTMAIQKSIETTRNRNGNPSALFFKNISEMENYANSIEPSPALAILTSTVGRGNMLFSPKTIALNIESNIVNFFTEAITRRIQNGAVNMAVDPQVIKDYLAYSREVFNTSGYQVSSMPSLDPTTQILSEKMTTTAGDRVVDKLGRFFEQTIFKYGLGVPDLFFKDMTFVDTANVLATKEAKGDSKKATELFKDICLIEPKTAKGKELREIAINEALVATYQNKGKTSDLALGIRNAINKASGSANLGDMLSPFVKTPANVIGLGFDYSMGGLVALKNIQTIYNDIQQGTFTETTRKSLRSLARNGIGFVAASIIASMIDDDDYIPEYALLDAKQRELVKMKGGVFNSVKIGNKYISLDYFGPLAMPLVSMLNARRGYDAKSKVWNYFQGSAYQSLKLPVIGDIKSLLEGTGRTLTKDIDTNLKMLEDAAIDFVASRSIPAIVTDIAKMTDEYERETNNNAINRLKSKVPIIREELPMQYNYGTGQPRETQNPVSQLFAGARVKEEITSPVIRELDRLYKKNTDEQLGLSKITKAGKLSSLSENQKNKIEKDFAKLYATKVSALVQTQKYQSLDNNDKVKAINKVRNSIRDDLKREYGLEKPKRSR